MDDINFIGNEKGTTAVETAIIFMLLLLFIFGIIEFGLLLFNKQVLTDASREGARAGVVLGLGRCCEPPPCEPEYMTKSEDIASNYCAEHLITFGSGGLSIDVDPDPPNCPSKGDNLKVSLTYDYDFLLLSAFKVINYPIHLEAVTTMRFE